MLMKLKIKSPKKEDRTFPLDIAFFGKSGQVRGCVSRDKHLIILYTVYTCVNVFQYGCMIVILVRVVVPTKEEGVGL